MITVFYAVFAPCFVLGTQYQSLGVGKHVVVGKHTYTNVTETWEPRISEVGGMLVVGVPVTLTCLVLLAVLALRWTDLGPGNIYRVYRRNVIHIYFKERISEDLYNMITKPGEIDPGPGHYNIFQHPPDFLYCLDGQVDGIYLTEVGGCGIGTTGPKVLGLEIPARVRICDNVSRELFSKVWISAESLISAEEWTPLPFNIRCVEIPDSVRLGLVVKSLIVTPLFHLLVDLMDVLVDCQYFVQLERGSIIDRDITRNKHVNNGILVFGLLGALKFGTYALFQLTAIKEYHKWFKSQLNTRKYVSTCFKMITEDCPELFLEYFYVDKFIMTQNAHWWLYLLVVWDLVKAGIYSPYKNYSRMKKAFRLRMIGSLRIRVAYGMGFVAQATISIAFFVRVIGMLYQWTSNTLPKQCLSVTDAGYLVQTPFAAGCLNVVDYLVLVLVVLTCLLLVVAYTLAAPEALTDAKYICGGRDGTHRMQMCASCYSFKDYFNSTKFYINGSRRYINIPDQQVDD